MKPNDKFCAFAQQIKAYFCAFVKIVLQNDYLHCIINSGEIEMKKAVTIKDIAEQLNLSRNTVAKALNGQYVPESTREAVLKKAREMNYKGLNAELWMQ